MTESGKRSGGVKMASGTLDERLTRLEVEVEQLKHARSPNGGPQVPWWEKIAGTFAGSADHEEAIRLGPEWRQSQLMDYDTPDA